MHRVANGLTDAGVGGDVEDDLRPCGLERSRERRTADVDLEECCLRIDVLAFAGGQDVHSSNAMAVRDERVHEVRADEARPACYQNVQRAYAFTLP